MKRPWWAIQLLWAVPLLLGVSCFVVWLLLLGNKGQGIADAVSVLVGTTSLVVTVFGLQHSTARKKAEKQRKPVPRWALAAIGAAIGAIGGAFFWFLVVKPDVPITDLVELSNAERMKDGEQASFAVPGRPPERRYLYFVPSLVNHEAVGDCVGSARLTVTLVRDGRKDPSFEERLSDREIRLDLDGTTREARVMVVLSVPDPTCVVDLGVTEAVLYN
ncbi:hypothetical protein ABZ816_40490 [Actinosynnema sp. NPDC047251]|uniref:Putative secreted protein n=1 Tax=Saccharothrix espanaensis (strain ATCC 51144 / DSM 44229 / JCM 9112 / NBRC 15066 / NRRL 15764) TaxID=1179773 RepID=K0JZX2_SACES|nr:hypothetical protein [Saccharothrix espanaensis]CCH29858.1 putative secreted protein [Saccharothrix espanaensis DSM 44229]